MGNKQSVQRHLDNSTRTGVFQLQNAKLVEIPEAVFTVTNLRSLDLSTNRLKELQADIGKLANLRTLLLANNQVVRLPEEIGKLTKLETLSLASNRLVELSTSFVHLAALRTLNLADNQLITFPTQLTALKHLDFVDLAHNNITALPAELGELNVCELNLNQNRISTIAAAVAKAPRLKVLRLEENCLHLDQLESILSSSAVSTLAVDGNPFTAKEMSDAPGYEKYMERYTASKKKI